MPDGKPTKAPVIIFGTMVSMSIITVGIVFYTHSQRTEPYLDTKMRRKRVIRRPRPAPTPSTAAPAATPTERPVLDAGVIGGARDDN